MGLFLSLTLLLLSELLLLDSLSLFETQLPLRLCDRLSFGSLHLGQDIAWTHEELLDHEGLEHGDEV